MTSLCNSPVNLNILWPSDVINPFPKIWGLLKWFWIMLCVGWFSIFLVGENHQLRGVWELDCRDLVILLSTRNGTTGLSSLQLLVFSREFLVTKVAERNANLWNFHPLKGTRCVGQPHMAPGFSGISWVPTIVGRKQIDSKQHRCLSQVSPPEKRLAPQEASFSDGFDMFSMFLLVGGGLFILAMAINTVFCSRLSERILGIFVWGCWCCPPLGLDEMEIFFVFGGDSDGYPFFSGMVVEGFQTLCFVVGILKVAL